MYDVVALIDNRYRELDGVDSVESIMKREFDCILVTPNETQTMVEQLKSLGVAPDKIVLLKNICHVKYAKNAIGLNCFGQHYDDLIVAAIFGMLGIAKPSYLDLGANHPYEYSNTALMHLSGCRGGNVDANRESIEMFKEQRPEDININIGVATEAGKLKFYKFGDMSGLNTFSDKEVEYFERTIKMSISKTELVEVTTLKNIIDSYCGGTFPDFLDCDIEGYDYDVLAGFDLKANGPKVICVGGIALEVDSPCWNMRTDISLNNWNNYGNLLKG